MTHRRNIAVIKTFGGYPAACMGFYPTVNSRFAKTNGETLRTACILFADLTNSCFLSSRMRTHAVRVSDSSTALPRVVGTPLASSKELRVSLLFIPLAATTISLIAYESYYSRFSDDASSSLDIACTMYPVSVPVKSPQRVPTTSIKLVRETHTYLLESLTHTAGVARCHGRRLYEPPVILFVVLVPGIVRILHNRQRMHIQTSRVGFHHMHWRTLVIRIAISHG